MDKDILKIAQQYSDRVSDPRIDELQRNIRYLNCVVHALVDLHSQEPNCHSTYKTSFSSIKNFLENGDLDTDGMPVYYCGK